MPTAIASAAVTALTSVGVGAAAAVAVGNFILWVAPLAFLSAASYAANAIFGEELPDPPEPNLQFTVRGQIQNQKIIYGEALVSGPVVYANVSPTVGTVDNEDLWTVIALAGHECEGITDVYIDGNLITQAQQTAGYGGWVTSGDYYDSVGAKGYVAIWKHLGTAVQTAHTLLLAFSDWTSAHRGRGITYGVVKCELDDISVDYFKRPPQNYKFLVQGKLVYDPRLDSTFPGGSGSHRLATVSTWEYSSNPALCLADYMIDTKLGAGFDSAKIDYTYVFNAADHCDELVAVPPAASPQNTEKRFTCNGAVWTSATHGSNIKRILSCFNGRIAFVAGQWRIRGGEYEASSASIDEKDIVSDIKIGTSTKKENRFNTVRGVFTDPDQEHSQVEFLPVQNATALTRDNNEVLYKDLALPLTNSETMAQRIAFRQLDQTSQQKVLLIDMNLAALNIAVGDTIDVTCTAPAYVAKIFRVEEWNFTDDKGIQLKLREDSSTAYDDPLVAEYTTRTASGAIVPAAQPVPPPTALTAVSMPGGIRVEWIPPVNRFLWQDVIIFASSSSTWNNNEVYRGPVSGFNFLWNNTSPQVSIVGKERFLWARSIDQFGRLSDRFPDSDTSTISAIGGAYGGTQPTSLTAVGIPGGIQVRWVLPPEGEFAEVILYASATEDWASPEAATEVFRGVASFLDHFFSNASPQVSLINKTRYYWIVSVDEAGNESGHGNDVSTVFATGLAWDYTTDIIFGPPAGSTDNTVFYLVANPTTQGVDGNWAKVTIAGVVTVWVKEAGVWIFVSDITSQNPPDFTDVTNTPTVFFLTSNPVAQGQDGDQAKVTIGGIVTYWLKESGTWILTSDITAQNPPDYPDVTNTPSVFFLTANPTSQGQDGDQAKVTIGGVVTYWLKESGTWILTSDITAQNPPDFTDVTNTPTVFFLTSNPTTQGQDQDQAKVTISGEVTIWIKEGSTWVKSGDITADNPPAYGDVTGSKPPTDADKTSTNESPTASVFFLTSNPTSQGVSGDQAKVTIGGVSTFWLKDGGTWKQTAADTDADKTSDNVAASVSGQAATATSSDFASVTGATKPADNADVTSANTAASITGQGPLATGTSFDSLTGSNKPANKATKSKVFAQAAAPSNPGDDLSAGDLWFAQLTGGLNRWSGSAWVLWGLNATLLGGFASTSWLRTTGTIASTTGAASDSDKLGGVAAASFLQTTGSIASTTGAADDSDKLGGVVAASYARTDVADTHASIITGLMKVTGNGTKWTGSDVVGTDAQIGFRWISGDGDMYGVVGNSTNFVVGSTSDYRTKDVIGELSGALDKILQLKIYDYTIKEDSRTSKVVRFGGLAHEFQTILPGLVSGTKDGMTDVVEEDDNGPRTDARGDPIKNTVPLMQSINYAGLSPLLVSAIQELTARIEVLENR